MSTPTTPTSTVDNATQREADTSQHCSRCGIGVNTLGRAVDGTLHPGKACEADATHTPASDDAPPANLNEAIESAIDWLCDTPVGTDQRQRGLDLAALWQPHQQSLIAAAPETARERDTLRVQRDELLEACKGALEYLVSPPFIALHGDMPAKLMRTSIAKAENEAQ